MFWYVLRLVLTPRPHPHPHAHPNPIRGPTPNLPLTRYVLHLLHGVGSWAQFHNARWKVRVRVRVRVRVKVRVRVRVS